MRIFGFHDNRACGYYRITLPLDALRDLGGHEIETCCGWNDRAREFPIVVAQRISHVDALGIWRRLALNHRLVYEIDDDLWTIDKTNYAAMQTHSAAVLDGSEEAIRIAHLVTVSTEPLAEIIRQFNPNVVVLPNHIDGRMLEIERPQREKFTVGWAGGDSHLRDLALVLPPLRKFLARQSTAEFHNIGTDFRFLFSLPDEQLHGFSSGRDLRLTIDRDTVRPGRYTDWSVQLFDYYQQIDFDIGLAPLVPSQFNRSKSAIKALEYMALGIPVIASDLEPYNGVVKHGVNGFLVRQEHEWGRYLWQLFKDPELRAEMGRQAKATATQWTIQENWRRWESAYASVLDRRTAVCA